MSNEFGSIAGTQVNQILIRLKYVPDNWSELSEMCMIYWKYCDEFKITSFNCCMFV